MKATWSYYELELKHTFSIAKFSRNSTPLVLLQLTLEGKTGYGEGSMVPYMGESPQSAEDFLKKIDWSRFRFPFNFEEIIQYLDTVAPGNPAVKAAVDIALNDLNGKLLNKPCYEIYGADPSAMPVTSYTVGIASAEILREKLRDASQFKVIKVKLGRDNDEDLIRTIRTITDLPLYVDANQGWTDRQQALDKINWLHNMGVELIEQPMDKNDVEGNAWITEHSIIPIIADESVQRLQNLPGIKGAYHGINVKLMKSAGMFEASKMIAAARSYGMKVLIGCMSETSCATLAAATLAPLCDWADLDGPFLTKNNPYQQPGFRDGKWILPNTPGLGLKI